MKRKQKRIDKFFDTITSTLFPFFTFVVCVGIVMGGLTYAFKDVEDCTSEPVKECYRYGKTFSIFTIQEDAQVSCNKDFDYYLNISTGSGCWTAKVKGFD